MAAAWRQAAAAGAGAHCSAQPRWARLDSRASARGLAGSWAACRYPSHPQWSSLIDLFGLCQAAGAGTGPPAPYPSANLPPQSTMSHPPTQPTPHPPGRKDIVRDKAKTAYGRNVPIRQAAMGAAALHAARQGLPQRAACAVQMCTAESYQQPTKQAMLQPLLRVPQANAASLLARSDNYS